MRIAVAAVDIDTLAQNWWALCLRGAVGVLFGLVTFVAPGISLAALVLLFAVYAFADGVLAITSAIRRRGASDHWWLLLLEGLAGVLRVEKVAGDGREDGFERLRLFVDPRDGLLDRVLQAVQGLNGDLQHVSLTQPSLEDVYLHLTGKELRE